MNSHHPLSMIVREVLADFIAGCPLAPEAMTDETVLVDGLGMDSLEKIEVTIRLEDIFSIELTDEATENVKTVGELIVLVAALHIFQEKSDEVAE